MSVQHLAGVVSVCDPAPVLELVEQALDEVAPAILSPVVRRGRFAIAFGGDDGLDPGPGDLVADGIGIIALVRQERLDLVGNHPEERRKTIDVVGLAGRQYEAERAAFGIAPGVEFGGEATTRSAKRLGFLSPLFMPTAQ